MFQLPMLPQLAALSASPAAASFDLAPPFASDATPVIRRDEAVDPVRHLERAAADFVAAFNSRDPIGHHHRCAAALVHVFGAIEHVEPHLSSEEILKRLQDVRRVVGSSPLAWRLQNWPRGYQGDFETIEMMCRGDSVALLSGGPRAIEQWALHCPPVQQHRNKINRQAALMLDTLLRPTTYAPAKVLSIASGPSRDVRQLIPVAHAVHGEIYLNDSDLDAVALSRRYLDGTLLRCQYLPGNVFRMHKALAAEGPFDLVLAGGLFDYLSDRQASYLITKVYAMLKPGGRFFFTNIVAGHAYRTCMEYVVNWTLIERTPEQVSSLCEPAGVPAAGLEITLGNAAFSFDGDVTIAVCGAEGNLWDVFVPGVQAGGVSRLQDGTAEPAFEGAFFDRHDIPNPFGHIHDQFLIKRLHKPAIHDRRRDAFFAESLSGLHRLPYGDPNRHDRHIGSILQQFTFPDR